MDAVGRYTEAAESCSTSAQLGDATVGLGMSLWEETQSLPICC
jgi:hypothetical protein